MFQLTTNITKIKVALRKYLKSYKDKTQAQLKEVEEKITQFYEDNVSGSIFNVQLSQLWAYESSHRSILEKEEKTRRLKRRSIHINDDDNNKKLFHQFVKNQKT
jgi:hypothetical protein